jgi:hypothetical protein
MKLESLCMLRRQMHCMLGTALNYIHADHDRVPSNYVRVTTRVNCGLIGNK